MDPKDEKLRELSNLLSSLNVQVTNLDSDQKRLIAQKEGFQMEIRRRKKEIDRIEVLLEELNQKIKNIDKKNFEIESSKKNLKKKIEKILAERNMLKNNF